MTTFGWQLMAVALVILCVAQWLAIYLLGKSLDDERDLVKWYRERAAKKNSEMFVLRNELLSIKEGLPVVDLPADTSQSGPGFRYPLYEAK